MKEKGQWILQDISIGVNIQNARMKQGLSQEQLVAKIQLFGSSMSRSTLANIEVGRRNIKASDLKAIKIALDIPYEELFYNASSDK